jgi:hypothetical protein
MAAILFIDFDASLSAAQGTGPTTWADVGKPPGVFCVQGVVAQNQNTAPTGYALPAGRTSNSTSFGLSSWVADSTFYNWGGNQIGVKRSTWGIGSECWLSADIIPSSIQVPTTANTDYRSAVFRWGDVSIDVKSCTLVVSTYTIVFSVKNNSTEVATITVPNCTTTSWLIMRVHCKLDGSTGLIEASINGVNQSVVYSNQNTVSSIGLSTTGSTTSADHIYVGPIVMTSGTTCYVGAIDNIYFDDSAVPTHRPRGERIALGTGSVDVNAAAVGTGASTISDALNNPTDAKAARFTGPSASTILDLASYSTTGLETNLIGFNLYAKRPASRAVNTTRYLSMGLSISGVNTMGTRAAATALAISSVTTPPNTDYNIQGLFEGIYTAGVTTSNLSNVKVRLLTL